MFGHLFWAIRYIERNYTKVAGTISFWIVLFGTKVYNIHGISAFFMVIVIIIRKNKQNKNIMACARKIAEMLYTNAQNHIWHNIFIVKI